MIIRKTLYAAVVLCFSLHIAGKNDQIQKFTCPTSYSVEKIKAPKGKKVKNVVVMIGDGMSLAHVQCAWTCNRGKLWLENAQYTGFSKTPIANRLIAESGSGGTAIAIGHKTTYHAAGVDATGKAQPSLVELAAQKGLSTGVAVTCRLWDATPCDFLCHHVDRDESELLIGQYPDSPVNYVFGGGQKYFKPENRPDKRDIFQELREKGYKILFTLNDFLKFKGEKAYCVVSDRDTPEPKERGDMLAQASLKELSLLDKNKKGFFLMIEGSQLDDYGHFNEIGKLMEETLDFDRTVGEVFQWAAKDGETLVVVTADHETGGLSLIGGELDSGTIEVRFATDDHSGTIVPIYAFGPGSENFTGFMNNTDIFMKIKKLLKL